MANFKATVTDNEGNSYNVDVNVPQFAFEKTLEDIKENLSKVTNNTSELDKLLTSFDKKFFLITLLSLLVLTVFLSRSRSIKKQPYELL